MSPDTSVLTRSNCWLDCRYSRFPAKTRPNWKQKDGSSTGPSSVTSCVTLRYLPAISSRAEGCATVTFWLASKLLLHRRFMPAARLRWLRFSADSKQRSEEHTSELQSLRHLVCRLLLQNNQIRSKENRAELYSLRQLRYHLRLAKT